LAGRSRYVYSSSEGDRISKNTSPAIMSCVVIGIDIVVLALMDRLKVAASTNQAISILATHA